MCRKGRQSWEGRENSNKDIFWVIVILSSSQSILFLPLHQKLPCTLRTCRHTVYRLGSSCVLSAFLGNPRLHHCRPVPCPGWEKNTLYFCHVWLLRVNSDFLCRNHSDGWEKSECKNHLYPLGLLRIPTAPGAPLLGLLCHPYSLCAGVPGYDCDHQNQSWASHPHVLLSQPCLLSRFLLPFCNHTHTPRDLGCGPKDCLLRGVHDAILWLHTCDYRNVRAGSDGLWLVCGCL